MHDDDECDCLSVCVQDVCVTKFMMILVCSVLMDQRKEIP